MIQQKNGKKVDSSLYMTDTDSTIESTDGIQLTPATQKQLVTHTQLVPHIGFTYSVNTSSQDDRNRVVQYIAKELHLIVCPTLKP